MIKKNRAKIRRRKNSYLHQNLKPGVLLILLPLISGIITLLFMTNGTYSQALGELGNDRLTTLNWQSARDAFTNRMPIYSQKFAYYKLKEGQTLDTVAQYFSVDRAALAKLNPGDVVAGTTIKVTPVEAPLTPIAAPNGLVAGATVTEDRGLLRIRQPYRLPLATTTIPELMVVLKRYNAIEQVAPKVFRINKAISIEGNIRLDITNDTVDTLQLRSAAHDITCLCLDQAAALLKNIAVTSYDPTTGKEDTDYADERAFVRAKNGRLDAINVTFSYLGNDLPDAAKKAERTNQAQKEGGTYGVSWRISDDMLGVEIATGWVEDSIFTHNHFGAYSYGASGIRWLGNDFIYNDVYGLDPHDDSNNALIENNLFAYNGKHGFIVSKRCDYNIIRSNISVGNKLHGYMLHKDSVYNLIENNIAYDNTDNFVVFDSDFNMIRSNLSYNARSSHVRINENARNNYVMNNQFVGGRRGIFAYGGVANLYVAGNAFKVNREVLSTEGAQNIFFGGNTIESLAYKINHGDRLIFGHNTVEQLLVTAPTKPPLPAGFNGPQHYTDIEVAGTAETEGAH